MSGLVKDGFYKQVDHKVGDDKYALLGAGGHKKWSTSNSKNTLVARDANKDIFARLFNTSESEMETTTPFSRVYVSNDSFIRWKSKANFAHELRDSGELDSRWVLKSGDTMTGDLKIDGTKNLSHGSWDHGVIVGADGHDKVVMSYLVSSTNGAVIGAHNSALSAWSILNISGTQLIFRNSETEKMRLDASGNFGIGTASPENKLDVNGIAQIYQRGNNNTAFRNLLFIKQQNSSEANGDTWSETNASFGIGFNRYWTSNNNPYGETNCAGIYATVSSNWRGGLVFRTKNNVTQSGSHDITALRLAPSGKAYFINQIVSSLATGTAPLAVTSTTLNTNLNADLLDGYHATDLCIEIIDLRKYT